MATIKIIAGVYGYFDGVTVKAKTPKDKPFELNDQRAAELVSAGVAAYVDAPAVAEKHVDGSELQELLDSVPGLEVVPEYNVNMKAAELREIAKGLGLEFPQGTTKKEMVAAMDKHIEENTVDDDTEIPGLDLDEVIK